MQIQLNTDNNVVGSEGLAAHVEADLRSTLQRFSDRITRVEVHLSDVNSGKAGGDDKRCLMEARVAGLQPTSVSDQAANVDQAISGAAHKLVRALDTVFGKREAARRSTASPAEDAGASQDLG